MRIVIALGGNALLRRGEPMTTEVQRRNVVIAAEAIAPLAAGHSIVVVHGNGPQVGLLSLQAESYPGAEPYPLDVLDAGTQGMIGYLIQQELRSLLPPEQAAACLVMAVVFKLDSIASIGSAVALVIFTMITAAHVRIRAETGASLPILILAIVAAGAVFVTFVFTTLIHEPASIVTIAGILVLSVALDYGWKHFHDTRAKDVQFAR
jgi:Amino acid kinase family